MVLTVCACFGRCPGRKSYLRVLSNQAKLRHKGTYTLMVSILPNRFRMGARFPGCSEFRKQGPEGPFDAPPLQGFSTAAGAAFSTAAGAAFSTAAGAAFSTAAGAGFSTAAGAGFSTAGAAFGSCSARSLTKIWVQSKVHIWSPSNT